MDSTDDNPGGATRPAAPISPDVSADPDEDTQKVTDLVESARIALVTTVAEGGKLVSRPLALPDRPFDGVLWFFTQDPSHKTAQVQANNQVNVSVQADHGYVSISGTGSVSKDQTMIDELWSKHAEAWFEGGRDDPGVALLRVEADSAEYWSIDSPKVITMIKYAQAMVTGQRPDLGDNASVDL